jgi:hypothetical protein
MRRLNPKLWRQKNWLLHHDNAFSHTSFFTKEFFYQNNMTVFTHPPSLLYLAPCNFPLFSLLKMKQKGHRFDTIEVIRAELQAVLNTLTEHGFWDAF